MKTVIKLGDRVQVIKGTDEASYRDCQLWIAGRVLVGEMGTVELDLEGGMCIVWDNQELKPKAGYYYGVFGDSESVQSFGSLKEAREYPDDQPICNSPLFLWLDAHEEPPQTFIEAADRFFNLYEDTRKGYLTSSEVRRLKKQFSYFWYMRKYDK